MTNFSKNLKNDVDEKRNILDNLIEYAGSFLKMTEYVKANLAASVDVIIAQLDCIRFGACSEGEVQ